MGDYIDTSYKVHYSRISICITCLLKYRACVETYSVYSSKLLKHHQPKSYLFQQSMQLVMSLHLQHD